MNNKNTLCAVILLVIICAGCAQQPFHQGYNPPGFFIGIWHGVIAPITLWFSIFSDIRIYAFPNSGVLYDFGFMLGLCAWGGGASYRR